MNRFKEARDRGGAFLAGLQGPDGSFPDSDQGAGAYWGMPIALQVSGHSNAANRLCEWIRANALTPEGDIGPSPEKAQDYYYAYPNSWVIEGAHRLGQFDLSQRGMDFLMSFWDSESGGFYSSVSERGAETKQDLWVVSGCGRAALYAGRVDVARAVGAWLRELMDRQPNYPRQMYTVYSRAKGLHTTPDPAEETRYVLHRDATRDEFFFNPGISGGFLARLYMATGDTEWLALAKEYMRLAEGASDYLFRLLRAGKTGWAAALLYTLTGEEKYRDMAVRVGDNIIALQAETGFWSGVAERTETPANSLTAEMVIWLDEIYQAVGHESGDSVPRRATEVPARSHTQAVVD